MHFALGAPAVFPLVLLWRFGFPLIWMARSYFAAQCACADEHISSMASYQCHHHCARALYGYGDIFSLRARRFQAPPSTLRSFVHSSLPAELSFALGTTPLIAVPGTAILNYIRAHHNRTGRPNQTMQRTAGCLMPSRCWATTLYSQPRAPSPAVADLGSR